jgi:hypothetical protein
LKLQETKDDRSFVQWYTTIRLWRLPPRVILQALPPESIKPTKYSGRGTPVLSPVSAGLYLGYLRSLNHSRHSRPR